MIHTPNTPTDKNTLPGKTETGDANVAGPGVDTISPLGKRLATDKRYYWFLVTYLVGLSAMGSFVNDMYSPALPSMCKFFGCTVSLEQMGLTMGMIGLGLGQILLGPISDHYGRKPVLIGSIAMFIIAAIVSIFSPTIHFFNTCRLFQGIGASGGYFLARTIPADVFSGRPLAKLMALVGAINGIAPASAPVIGGVTSDTFGWKGVFVVLFIFAVILLSFSPLLKESLPRSGRTLGKWWHNFSGYRQLLANRPFVIHICFKGVALGILFAYISSSPFIFQTHYGLTQTQYGLLIGFNAIFVATGSMLALKFHPLKKAASAGAMIMAAGVIGEVISLYIVGNIWIHEAFILVMLIGLGLIFTTSNTLAMNEGRQKAGEASALLGVSGYIVGAIVAPLVGLGNILHSTAIVFGILAIIVVLLSRMSAAQAPDLDK
ncbi:MAG: multidrug effflux MFS transporter [Clostridiales bacterium]|nr:multidrug effflux MFS transporter [Clostridiales bacterium]